MPRSLHDDSPNNIGVRIQINKGDMDRALAEAYLVREDRFDTQRVHQSYAEPYGCRGGLGGEPTRSPFTPEP